MLRACPECLGTPMRRVMKPQLRGSVENQPRPHVSRRIPQLWAEHRRVCRRAALMGSSRAHTRHRVEPGHVGESSPLLCLGEHVAVAVEQELRVAHHLLGLILD
eukprot:scaffold7681_cov135-Isochrysis_galbana.AAC.4